MFMLDTQTAAGYTEMVVPLLVHDDAVKGTGQLPKFADDLFLAIAVNHSQPSISASTYAAETDIPAIQMATTRRFQEQSKKRYGLIPTAEVPLTN